MKLEETVIEDTVTDEEVRSFLVLLNYFYASGELGKCDFMIGSMDLEEYFESLDIYVDSDISDYHSVMDSKCSREKLRFLTDFLSFEENKSWGDVLEDLITEFWTYYRDEEWLLIDYLFHKGGEECRCDSCLEKKVQEKEKYILKLSSTVYNNNQKPYKKTGDLKETRTHRKNSSPIRSNTSQKCYILKDKANGRYKIGCSKNPLQREKTLQSEKPDYELVKVFEKNHERKLHKEYEEHRVRGEWFKLTPVQVKYICTHYK